MYRLIDTYVLGVKIEKKIVLFKDMHFNRVFDGDHEYANCFEI